MPHQLAGRWGGLEALFVGGGCRGVAGNLFDGARVHGRRRGHRSGHRGRIDDLGPDAEVDAGDVQRGARTAVDVVGGGGRRRPDGAGRAPGEVVLLHDLVRAGRRHHRLVVAAVFAREGGGVGEAVVDDAGAGRHAQGAQQGRGQELGKRRSHVVDLFNYRGLAGREPLSRMPLRLCV